MERICPFQLADSKLFSGPTFMESTPADNPTFYKGNRTRGELHNPTDAKSAFHPDLTSRPSDLHKTQGPAGMTRNIPTYSPASSSQMTPYERFIEFTPSDDDIMESDIDIELGPDTMNVDELYFDSGGYAPCHTFNQWSDWDTVGFRLAPIPAPTTRLSKECIPVMPKEHELLWKGSNVQQYNLRHQGPPQRRCDGWDGFPVQGNIPHFQPPYTQPHNTPLNRNPSSSSSLSLPTLTSSSSNHKALPLHSTVSPSASSDTSSSSSSPLSSPELTVRTPITLHQPRPSRRIPIISLSELALACDDFPVSPSNQSPPYQGPLSPLTLDFPAKDTSIYSPVYASLSGQQRIENPRFTQHAAEDNYTYVNTAPTCYIRDSSEVVLCSCGCMESYVIPQNKHYPIA